MWAQELEIWNPRGCRPGWLAAAGQNAKVPKGGAVGPRTRDLESSRLQAWLAGSGWLAAAGHNANVPKCLAVGLYY